MHLQEIHFVTFDLDLENVTQYPLRIVVNAAAKFQVATYNGSGEFLEIQSSQQVSIRGYGQTDDRPTLV